MKCPAIIWSMPRCGSTTVMSLVNHAGGYYLNEPFSNKNFKADFRDRALKEPIADVLTSIFEQCDGFKHTAHPSGWPFPDIRKDINYSILMCPGIRFVLLKRANRLKMVVSSLIAQQCGLWNCHLPAEREKRIDHPFSYLDPEQVGKELRESENFMNLCHNFLRRSGNEFITITMEDVLNPDSNTPNHLLGFCGLKELSKSDLDSLLAIDRGQLSESVYNKIPDIQTIEHLFGGEEWGRLT